MISLQGGGIIQESLGAIIPLQTGGFTGIGRSLNTLSHSLVVTTIEVLSTRRIERPAFGSTRILRS